MAILLLHRCSGVTTVESGSAGDYARDHGFDLVATVLDGEECAKMVRNGDWVATAQAIVF